MPTEELFGNYHFLLEVAGANDPYKTFKFQVVWDGRDAPDFGSGLQAVVFEPNDETLWEQSTPTPVEFTMFLADGTPVRAETGGTAVAVETLTLAHEGIDWSADVRQYFAEGGQRLYLSPVASDEDGDTFVFHTDPDLRKGRSWCRMSTLPKTGPFRRVTPGPRISAT